MSKVTTIGLDIAKPFAELLTLPCSVSHSRRSSTAQHFPPLNASGADG
ncbi:hypothetical protein [Solirhodobacter olei]|nr:hypothetical protein [Solirhodobacter olei]